MNCLKHWKADGTWWDPVRFVLFGGSMQQMAWGELWEPLHTRRLDEVWVLGWISGLFVKIHTDWGVGRIRVELAFRQELVLMFAPAGNICSLLAFGATVSFLSPFVRPSTVSFIHPSIHWLFKFCTYLKCGYLSIRDYLYYVLEASTHTCSRHPYNFFQHVRRSARRVALWDLKGPEAKQRPGNRRIVFSVTLIVQVWWVLCYRLIYNGL